jgi:hypothetical protein
MHTENTENNKKIEITGTNNRYLIKRANRVKNEIKKREIINKYNISEIYLKHDMQLQLLKDFFNKINIESNSFAKDILIQELERKITSYKQQDLIKKIYNNSLFIDMDCVVKKLLESEMKCFYCGCEVVILYEIVRELTQWSVDRINNDQGHNKDNFVIACLNCNIKRRNINSNKFLFTKQLNLIKTDG